MRAATKREAIVKKLAALAGLLVLGGALGVILASRGSDQASPPAAPLAQTRSNPYPYMNPIKRKGSSSARLAGDGRYFGYVRGAGAETQPRTISFDVAQFFFGKDVQKAAEEDGAVAPGESVSNDHYERNPEMHAQTLTVANDASMTAAGVSRLIRYRQALARCRSGCTGGAIPVSRAEFFAAFEKKRDGMTAAGDPVWVTIRDGLVVRIDEQYFP
jgi:hypothetical protein